MLWFAVAFVVLVVIPLLLGRLLGGFAFAVPLVLIGALLAFAALAPSDDPRGEDSVWLGGVVYTIALTIAEASVLIGWAWRQWKASRRSATVSANARSVASGSSRA